MPVKKSIAAEVKPAAKPAVKKPAVKKPAAKKPAAKPAAKAPVASIKVPAKVAAAAAKPATKKAATKRKPVDQIPAALKEILASFKTGGLSRTESLGGKVSKAQKEALARVAKKYDITPSELVAALVINFLSVADV
ncbi:hypothetical protein PA10_00298 [Pseudomonas phage pPa_SNUABM_DT01]|nr:hypothetical protein PA10_00298 [Pseudomonas phage pPa_SNUABM_DT01]